MVDLTDRDDVRFAELRERLDDVEREAQDRPVPDATLGPIDPMLAQATDRTIDSFDPAEWLAERKYDGTRLVVQRVDGKTRCYTRRGVERSGPIPAVVDALEGLETSVFLDGELAFLDEAGRCVFVPIHTDPSRIEDRGLSYYLFVFDVLYYDGEWVLEKSLTERKALLEEAITPIEGPTPPGPWDESLADAFDDRPGETADPESPVVPTPFAEDSFEAVYRELTEHGEEGVMLKRRRSRYHLDTRSAQWLKVKATLERDAVAVGYTEGEGRRKDTFGALVLTDGETHVGSVGSGFSDDELTTLAAEMEPVEERPIGESTVGKPYTPVEPFVVRVRYQEATSSGHLRAPVYVHSRPDVPLEDVQPIEPKRS
jgi:bifunctional non-homologous end joining protein LigD